MTPIDPDLLRPSLSASAAPAAAPYSAQMGMFSAFFGGPFAAVAWAVLNARRTGQWRRDLTLLVLLTAVAVAWVSVAHVAGGHPAVVEFGAEWFGRRGGVVMDRFVALMIFAAASWMQRREQRTASLFGLPTPNGWLPGIGLIAAGWLALAAVEFVTRR